MKKSVYLLGIVLAVLSVFFLFSCSNIADKEEEFKAVLTAEESKSERAYIRVNVENTDSAPTRTLLPKIELSNLVLTGSREGGEAQVLATASALAEMSAKQIEIQTGNWAFTLTATVSGVAYSSGEVSKTIESGGENPLSFTLEPADGATTGTLDFSLTFTGTEGVDYEVIVKFDNDVTTKQTSTVPYRSGQTIRWPADSDHGFTSLDFTTGASNKTHTIEVKFYAKNIDNNNNTDTKELNTYQSIFRVERGITTKAAITGINLNQVYSITYNNIENTDSTADTLVLKFFRKSDEISLPSYTTTVPELIFSGWYKNDDFTGDPITEIEPLDTETDNLKNLQLYAKWIYSSEGIITTSSEYNFSFEVNSNTLKPNKEKTISITPTVKKSGVLAEYDAENQEVDGHSVTWDFALYNGGTLLHEDLTQTKTEKGISIAIPAVPYADKYSLHVSAELCGIKHCSNFILGSLQPIDVAAEKAKINSASTGNIVKIEAILNEDQVKQIAKVAGAKPIILDLSESEGFTTVPENAFNQGSAIQGIILPEGVTKIDKNAFWCLYGLKTLHIPASVTEIDGSAFFLCATNNGLDITLGEGSTTFKYENGAIYTLDGKKLVRFCNGSSTSAFTVPATVEVIAEYAFTGAKMYTIAFEEGSSLKSIEQYAFDKCINITSISIPDSVTTMGSAALRYCDNLSSVKLPAGWTVIDKSLFGFDTKLATLKIPEGVTKICNSTFSNNYPPIETLYLPASLTEIETSAFSSSNKLKYVNYAGTLTQRNAIKNINSIYLIKNATWSYEVSY